MDVAVTGALGDVGLPLAVAFGKVVPTMESDLSASKWQGLLLRLGPSGPDSVANTQASTKLSLTDQADALCRASFLLVSASTPIDQARESGFTPLNYTRESAGLQFRSCTTVIYESTEYPAPELEIVSGRQCIHNLHADSSPERVNPGDSSDTVERVVATGVRRVPSLKAQEPTRVRAEHGIDSAEREELSRADAKIAHGARFHMQETTLTQVIESSGRVVHARERVDTCLLASTCVPV